MSRGWTYPLGIDLWVDGAWLAIPLTDVSSEGVSISRGRADEAGQPDPAEMTARVRSDDGRLSPRNPRSPLFGKIGRNTPIRCWVQAGTPRLVQPAGVAHAEAPSTTALSLTADFDLRAELALPSWRPPVACWLGVSKPGAYGMYLTPEGYLVCAWWDPGQSGALRAIGVSATARMPVLPNVPPIADTLPGFDITSWNGVVAPAGTTTLPGIDTSDDLLRSATMTPAAGAAADSGRRLVDTLASLKLTVFLLVLSMILVLLGTLEQVHWGVWHVQKVYFSDWLCFYPMDPTAAFRMPLPGGFLIGALLIVNLTFAHFRHFKATAAKVGISMIHAGLLLLLSAARAERVPWTTSRVVGSPEPPPPARVERAFPVIDAVRPGRDLLPHGAFAGLQDRFTT